MLNYLVYLGVSFLCSSLESVCAQNYINNVPFSFVHLLNYESGSVVISFSVV